MKRMVLTCCAIWLSTVVFAAPGDSAVLSRISAHILSQGKCYEDLRTLCKQIGHRISASPEAEKAVAWGEAALRAAGCDRVWLQPVQVPKWVRGEEHLALRFSPDQPYVDVPVLSLGNSEGTNDKIKKAEIVMVESFDAYKKLNPTELEGKFIFFNYHFRHDFPQTFNAYGDAVKYRWQTPEVIGKTKIAGVIIRSVSSGADDFPHTGGTMYPDKENVFPLVAIGNKTADRLEAACRKGTTAAMLRSNCGLKGTAMSYNVIGEITGSVHPQDYMVVGGHLDSWDVGEGAHDDGAGCVQAIEVLRTFKSLAIKPKHSIRAVLFMNEENGAKGGRAYADSARVRKEHHIVALESDAGGFAPRGFELSWNAKQKQAFMAFAPLLQRYGIYDFEKEGGGVDVGFLKNNGSIIGELIPDSQRYFDVHHTDNDVFETVNHRELKMGAAAMAQFIYLADQYEILD
ncbi:M20/M25/M40 family metallo-hydrolase [Rurimicrobium arvi]|uniref:Carboxypeptidase Q n=1 Tax=Rurimicrobium arvi TaxID=2049916 RepID=A0ABP8MK20_9BACT